MNSLITVGLLALAVSTGSLTLSKSKVFAGLRAFCDKKLPFVGRMLECPYCTAHWVSVLYTSLVWDAIPTVSSYPVVNILLVALAVIPLAVPLMLMMYEKIPLMVGD